MGSIVASSLSGELKSSWFGEFLVKIDISIEMKGREKFKKAGVDDAVASGSVDIRKCFDKASSATSSRESEGNKRMLSLVENSEGGIVNVTYVNSGHINANDQKMVF